MAEGTGACALLEPVPCQTSLLPDDFFAEYSLLERLIALILIGHKSVLQELALCSWMSFETG